MVDWRFRFLICIAVSFVTTLWHGSGFLKEIMPIDCQKKRLTSIENQQSHCQNQKNYYIYHLTLIPPKLFTRAKSFI